MPVAKITCIPGVTLNGLARVVITELTLFQTFIDTPIIVTSALRQGDSAEHGKGLAVDIMAPSYENKLLDLYIAAERFNFKGIGVYPYWQYNGSVIGGLHLDIRIAEHGARWTGVKGPDGKNQYFALDKETLQKYGVI